MSSDQSRSDENEPLQYRGSGRTGNRAQQRIFPVVLGRAEATPSLHLPPQSLPIPNRRRKKVNSAQGGKSRAAGSSVIADANVSVNLDEQKRDQARHVPLRGATSTFPTVLKQQWKKKYVVTSDQSNITEPSGHSIPGVMSMQFHQPQIPVQFGGSNPQIQSQAMVNSSMPMPMPMPIPLLMENPPQVKQHAFETRPLTVPFRPVGGDYVTLRFQSIINKLTPQNFEKLFEQVKQVNIDNADTLSCVVVQIFEKALMQPTSCGMYANFCQHLAGELPDFCKDNERITFKRLLVNKCQEEFERGEREREEANRVDEVGDVKQTEEEREEKRIMARRRMLGNIQFIGELYKKRMLTERIMHTCIHKLLGIVEDPVEEDVEALCKLMSTIGEMIDHPEAKEHMDAYFEMMYKLSNSMKLSSRVRYLLKYSIDLRENKWQQRWKVKGPRKIDEFHRDASQEPQAQSSRLARGPSPQGNVLRNNIDSNRWQRLTYFHKGLIPSPHTPLQVMHKAERMYEVGRITDEEQAKQRQLKGILNKLTPQNFEKLFEQVKQVNINNAGTLAGVIAQIFDKALMEPTFCEMYANLCHHLAVELPDFSEDNEKITLKRLLLNKCQEEFERGEWEQEEANKAEEEVDVKQTVEEREEKRTKARRRMLGNILFFGELYKKRMLTERVMHTCIRKLLGEYQNPVEENVEALCKLMSTIGEMVDHPKAKEHMDAYFEMMYMLSNNMELSSRVRFLLKDSIDLRKKEWQQRRKVEPKNID